MSSKWKAVFYRFLRTFVYGGVANLAAVMASTNLDSYKDVEAWVLALTFAFLTGGVVAIDKWMRWEEPEIEEE